MSTPKAASHWLLTAIAGRSTTLRSDELIGRESQARIRARRLARACGAPVFAYERGRAVCSFVAWP